MTTILLTSRGLTPKQTASRFADLKQHLGLRTCGLVYNATGSPNSKYVALAKKQLESAGLQVTMLDARIMDDQKYDVMYIAGGNTFTLLSDINNGVGADAFKQVVLASQLIIAVSAGAVLLTPTIRIVSEIQPDQNEEELTDYTALSILDYEILPHYSERLKDELAAYKKRHRTKVVTCAEEDYVEIEI